MFKIKVPAVYLLLSVIAALSITCFAFRGFEKNKEASVQINQDNLKKSDNCGHNVIRLDGFKYIRPIMGAERECESIEKYSSLKSEISNFIDHEKNTGEIVSVSVYLEDCTNDDWMGINADDMFLPGSLLKVPTMVTYLKMAEKDPGLLEREFTFNSKDFPKAPKQTFESKTIQSGHKYKVKELFYYMLAYSDNYATWLLNSRMDVEVYKKVYSQIGLPEPKEYASYALSAKQYSKLMKVLYDVGYLTISSSEYAMSLMSACDFKEGLVKKLPPKVKVAHKFGEAGVAPLSELHESAVVYLGDTPYLLTVMTKGKNVLRQAGVMSDISKMVYDHMVAINKH